MVKPRAVVTDGVVVNTVMAWPEDAGSVAIPDGVSVSIGWGFDGVTFSAPPEPAHVFRSFSYSGFIDALTRAEAIAVLTGAKTDPLLEMFVEIARARSAVDFNDQSTRDSAPYLVQAGIVTAERLAELIG